MVDYIVLRNAGLTIQKRFRVFSGGYTALRTRQNATNRTWTGKLDNQVARSVKIRRYTLIVYEAELTDMGETDTIVEGYGTLAHIQQFFSINSVETGAHLSGPSLIPANRLILTDFDEADYNVLLVGPYHPKNLSRKLDGVAAPYYLPIELLVLD